MPNLRVSICLHCRNQAGGARFRIEGTLLNRKQNDLTELSHSLEAPHFPLIRFLFVHAFHFIVGQVAYETDIVPEA